MQIETANRLPPRSVVGGPAGSKVVCRLASAAARLRRCCFAVLAATLAGCCLVPLASAATCTAATNGGSAPADWPSYCWLDFSSYNDTQARSAAGQPFSFTLSDGSVLSFTAKVSSSAGTALTAVSEPSWTGSAVGNTAFLGISGKPILYTATNGSTVTVTFSGVTLTPPPGVTGGNTYDFVAADAESTNGGESLGFTTNGGNWIVLDQVPPISGNIYPTTNNSGSTFTETGVGGTVGGYIVGSTNATQVSTVLVAGGLQGAMFALRYSAISLTTKIVGGRIYAADQFTYKISLTASGSTLGTATSSGTGNGPFGTTSSFITTPQSLTLTESLASGSVSPMSAYSPTLTCTNSTAGSSTAMPANSAGYSYVFGGIAYGDVIACVFTTTANAPALPDHFAVVVPAAAVNCAPAAVTITAHDSQHRAFATNVAVAIATSTGHGDWTLTTGGGVLTPGPSNSGTASYQFVPADFGQVVLALRDTYPETLTVIPSFGVVTATSGSALGSEDVPFSFAPSGFRMTAANNVGTSIGTQIAGVASTQTLSLQAIRTDTKTGACTSAFASGTTVNIGVAFQCNNPASCVAGQSFTITNNGVTTSIAANPAVGATNYTTVPIKFSTVNAEAPIIINYSDAGDISLLEKYLIPLGSGSNSINAMLGSSEFIVQPYALTLSNIKRTADGFANPGTSTATGTVFIGAGQPFSATVSATNARGAPTPNFGQESVPPTVILNSALILPLAGNNPAVSGAFGAYSGGSAVGSGFSWAEAGSLTLTPAVANYLGSGPITGTTAGPVGRFVPNNFAVALNTPLLGTTCAAGGYSYLGQPLGYAVAPVITATAQAQGGSTTQNYTATLMRVTNTSLTGRSYTSTPAVPALSTAGLPATTVDPVIADLGSGLFTLTFGAGSGLVLSHAAVLAPFNANIALAINVIDQDGVAATNPVKFNGSGSGMYFNSSATQYYGRMAIRNALGSELLDLPMSLVTQVYLGPSQGFGTNTHDVCTVAPKLGFSNYQLNLAAGKTCVRDSGSPGVSGAGCAAPATGLAFNPTAAAGNFNLNLAAPGTGNNGAVTVTASAPAWLQYPWNAASGTDSSPSGLATFGIFQGPPALIYERETY